MAAQAGQPVCLDASLVEAKHGAGFLAHRFPSIDRAAKERGLDWARVPIPVTPAAHYWMGGVRTDLWGRTSIPGLFAVGEVACTGVHGANRLASNSLLESVVLAWRTAQLLNGSAYDLMSKNDKSSGAIRVDKPRGVILTTQVDRLALQRLMWNAVGIERDASTLRAAIFQLNSWHAAGADVESLETANLLDIGRVMAAAALARTESRGAHYRRDFPAKSTAWQHSLVYSRWPVLRRRARAQDSVTIA